VTGHEILELAIDRYKNLDRVRVEWGPRVVLYGMNGTGKTNMLEALALALGNRATMWQLADRAVAPAADAIQITMRTNGRQLPLPPTVSMKNGEPLGTDKRPPWGTQWVGSSGLFWSWLGVTRGDSWSEAIHSGVVDARLATLLAVQAAAPIIRYRLQEVHGLEEARCCDRSRFDEVLPDPSGVTFDRVFSRCLCVEGDVPEWLVDLAAELPDPFTPLRRWLDEPSELRGPYADLLELPPSNTIPACVVWLSAERTEREAFFDLWEASDAAVGPIEALLDYADYLLLHEHDEEEGERPNVVHAEFTVSEIAADVVKRVASDVAPDLDAYVITEGIASLTIQSSNKAPAGSLWNFETFRHLCSAHRVWLDIALARAAAELELRVSGVRWMLVGLGRLAEEERLAAGILVADQLDEVLETWTWHGRDLDELMRQVQRVLGSPEQVAEKYQRDVLYRFADASEAERRYVAETGLETALDRPLTVHVLDEPERHLHPQAQRETAARLSTALDDACLVLATHSHYFLGKPGWRHIHLGQTPDGNVATFFDPAELTIRHSIAGDMGLTNGELLTRYRYVLFVEGPADQAVLRALYRAWLDEAGILVLPMHGIDGVASLAELELIGTVIAVRCGVLADNTLQSHLQPGYSGKLTKEERELRNLKHRRGHLDVFGLKHPDILAYLDEMEIQREVPEFPGWHQLEQAMHRGESLKDAFERVTGERPTVRLITTVATAMARSSTIASGDLRDVVASIVAAAVADTYTSARHG